MGIGVALLPRRCALTEIARGHLVAVKVPELSSPRSGRLVFRRPASCRAPRRPFSRSSEPARFRTEATCDATLIAPRSQQRSFSGSRVVPSRRLAHVSRTGSARLRTASRRATASTSSYRSSSKPVASQLPSRKRIRARRRASVIGYVASRRHDVACVEIDRQLAATDPARRASISVVERRRRRGQARHPERNGVAEEDFRERLAHDRADAAAADRLRRVLARRSAAEVGVHEQDRAPRVAGSRMDAPSPPRRCFRSSSNRCCSSPSKVTDLRNRAGMMRSVSMLSPRSGQRACRCTSRICSIGQRSPPPSTRARRRPRPRPPRPPPSPGSSAACGRSGCPAGP